MTEKTIIISAEGLTLSRVVWQFLRKQPVGYLERVLMLNTGLADAGAILPVGTVVRLPVDAVSDSAATRKVVRLWD